MAELVDKVDKVEDPAPALSKSSKKKNKKKAGGKEPVASEEAGEAAVVAEAAPAAPAGAGESQGSSRQGRDEVLQLVEQMRQSGCGSLGASSSTAADRGVVGGELSASVHKFWDTQPVPKLGERIDDVAVNGVIEENIPEDKLRREPFKMPEGFAWSELEVTSEAILAEIYTLLNENYVEDDDAMFRFDYSMAFLKWALTPPNYTKEFHLGVRNARSGGKLMAFITGVPATAVVRGKKVRVVEINYLCVHKKLRTKRLAPVLIKEITRRVNLKGIFQAVYTAGVVLPKPVASCRYYHRSLDPKKLIEIGFSRLMPRMTMARTIKLYKLPESPAHSRLRAMVPADVPKAHALLAKYLSTFALAPALDAEEFAHWVLPRPGVIDAFVVDTPEGEITDLCSFYHLPSTVIGHDKHNTLKAGYSFYNVATSMTLKELMRDALICAKRVDMDVFNALNIMENDQFLKDLKFGIGDGHLQYYLYNWKCPKIEPSGIGLVLL